VNPYVVPFVDVDGGGILESRFRRQLLLTLKAFLGNELKHIISQFSTLGLLPIPLKRFLNLVTQQYKGHVTIVPKAKLSNYKNVLINPGHEEYKEAMASTYVSTL
jgi:hypothetical protein